MVKDDIIAMNHVGTGSKNILSAGVALEYRNRKTSVALEVCPLVARDNLQASLTARCDSRILVEERNKEYDLPQALHPYIYAPCISPTTTDMIR